MQRDFSEQRGKSLLGIVDYVTCVIHVFYSTSVYLHNCIVDTTTRRAYLGVDYFACVIRMLSISTDSTTVNLHNRVPHT